MTSTLRTLLDRVEQGEGADREIDRDLHAATHAPPPRGCVYGRIPPYTTSTDAAVALVAKVLPGHDHEVFRDRDAKLVTVDLTKPIGGGASSGYLGQHAEEPRATLLALLRAKIAQEGEEAYWSAPKDEDRCTAMAAAYRAMRAAAKADAPDPHVLQDRLHGMLRMAVASEDSFNRLSPAGRRLIQAAEGFFASSREDRDDLNACWDALQAETKRADAAEARLAALLRAKIAQEERT